MYKEALIKINTIVDSPANHILKMYIREKRNKRLHPSFHGEVLVLCMMDTCFSVLKKMFATA